MGGAKPQGFPLFRFITINKPIVSAINGVAVGAGLAVALMADVSIDSEAVRITDGHLRLGVAGGDHAVIIWPLPPAAARGRRAAGPRARRGHESMPRERGLQGRRMQTIRKRLVGSLFVAPLFWNTSAPDCLAVKWKEFEVTKKLSVVATSLVLAGVLTLSLGLPSAHAAAKKVDCDAVMSALSGGKKPKEVAKDLGISVSSVRKCRKKAAAASSPQASPAPSPK